MNSNFVTHARSDNLYNNSKNNKIDTVKVNYINKINDNYAKSTLSMPSYSQRMQ